MPSIIFTFEEENGWKVKVENRGCSAAQLVIASEALVDESIFNSDLDPNTLIAEFAPTSLLGRYVSGANVHLEQEIIAAKWCEIMGERGFALMMMEAEAAAKLQQQMVPGSEDEIEMLRAAGKLQRMSDPN